MLWGNGAIAVAVTLAGATAAGAAGPMPVEKAAALFGARAAVEQISLSPAGTQVAYITPSSARGDAVMVAGIGGEAKSIVATDGVSSRLIDCGWSGTDRLVCRRFGLIEGISFTRQFAIDSAGGNLKEIARRNSVSNLRISQFDGRVIDWMSGADGNVLMMRDYVPELGGDTNIKRDKDGLGVDRVDTRTMRSVTVEKARSNAAGYISDGRGTVRIMSTEDYDGVGLLTGKTTYFYRDATGAGQWQRLVEDSTDDSGWRPIAVDAGTNAAYALRKLDGRQALYRISLDGKATKELVYAHPKVDVDGVLQVGRNARVIGATYVTDRSETEFFDPVYRKLMGALAKAVPHLPLISFVDASADENVLLLRAASDIDPGHYYVLDRKRGDMKEILLERAGFEGESLAPVKAITYRAGDGAMVPGYLTMPVGGPAKGLPAIVMPHGGPASRDEWGFDWLSQFYAARGYAVLQPNFRGSTGYGDEWFADNGFKSWKIAIADIAAAGRWLVSEGIGDPARLAVVGWSYGGYAALQSAVVDPGLFKAVVAVAPVTDLAMLKRESIGFTNAKIMRDYIGAGPHIVEGSPLRRAREIKVPVLMFHGDKDANVAIAESREMDQALKAAGAKSELVTYPGLDHQLPDSTARTDMLKRSDAFLRAALKL